VEETACGRTHLIDWPVVDGILERISLEVTTVVCDQLDKSGVERNRLKVAIDCLVIPAPRNQRKTTKGSVPVIHGYGRTTVSRSTKKKPAENQNQLKKDRVVETRVFDTARGSTSLWLQYLKNLTSLWDMGCLGTMHFKPRRGRLVVATDSAWTHPSLNDSSVWHTLVK
jgi:hypothetical protein